MEFDVFQDILARVPANVRICFSGMSEPWANPECTRMALHSHATGHQVSVFTTLVGMTISDVQQFKHIPFCTFVVHLPSGEGYEKITIDDDYLEVLTRLSAGSLVTQWLCLGETLHPLVARTLDRTVSIGQVFTRAGNVTIDDRPAPRRRKGRIRCERNLRQNILLPNGDVLLCCMDYGMNHVLGNLKEQDYESLFRGREFQLVEQGLADESEEILCRYCDCFVRDVDLRAKIGNNLAGRIKAIKTPKDAFTLIPDLVRGVRKHFFLEQGSQTDNQ